MPAFVGTEKGGLLASVEEEDVVEDELGVGIGRLDVINQTLACIFYDEGFLRTFCISSTILSHILSEWNANNSDWSRSSQACSICIEVWRYCSVARHDVKHCRTNDTHDVAHHGMRRRRKQSA